MVIHRFVIIGSNVVDHLRQDLATIVLGTKEVISITALPVRDELGRRRGDTLEFRVFRLGNFQIMIDKDAFFINAQDSFTGDHVTVEADSERDLVTITVAAE